jgi:hypothetical protein
MKLKSNPKNPRILAANGKTVQHDGIVYKLRSCLLGKTLLADVEPIFNRNINTDVSGKNVINIFANNLLAKTIRNKIEMGIVS